MSDYWSRKLTALIATVTGNTTAITAKLDKPTGTATAGYVPTAQAGGGTAWAPVTATATPNPYLRTGALSESYSRDGKTITNIAAVAGGIEGPSQLVRVTPGQVITSATFLSGSTAAVTPTHQWFTLRDLSYALLRVTSDDTTTAWAANAEKTLAFASTYTVPAGVYGVRVGIVVTAATVPNLKGINGDTTSHKLAPTVVTADTTHTGLTTPSTAADPFTPQTGGYAFQPYCWLG